MKKLHLIAALALLSLLGQKSAFAALPPFEQISQGYTQVPVTGQNSPRGLFSLWSKKADAQLLGELPKSFAGKQYFIALTVSSGDKYAGLQSGDWVRLKVLINKVQILQFHLLRCYQIIGNLMKAVL